MYTYKIAAVCCSVLRREGLEARLGAIPAVLLLLGAALLPGTAEAQAPGAPGGLRTVEGDKQLTLHWSAPTTGGAPASYQYRQRTGTTFADGWQPAGTGTEHVVTGLLNDTTYTFQVRAANSAGNSLTMSNEAGGTPRPPQAKMYWTDSATEKIQRANLDGGTVEDIVVSLRYPGSIAIDAAGGKIYWINFSAKKIQRANLDGSSREDLVTSGLNNPSGIAVDTVGRKIYWADIATRRVQRANLDGSSKEDLVTSGLNSPESVALDLAAGKMYWTDNSTGAMGTRRILRGDISANPTRETFVTYNSAWGVLSVAVDASSGGKVYWNRSSQGMYQIWRADKEDGTSAARILTTTQVGGFALDAVAGKVYYWTGSGAKKIRRVNMDGSGSPEDLVASGLENLLGIALLLKPSAPTGVTATAGRRQVSLQWQLPVVAGSVAGYEYRYKTAATNYTGWQPVGTATMHTVTGLAGGTEYTFQVRAANRAGGGPAFTTTATVPPDAPTGLRTVEGDKQLALHWTAPGGTVTGYQYRRKSGGGTYGGWQAAAGTFAEHVVTGLVNGTAYAFQVRATGGGGNSAVSNEAGGTPRPPQAKMYWGVGINNRTIPEQIRRSNLDGTTVETVLTTGFLNASQIGGLAVDAARGKIYWADRRMGTIHRANLDGTGKENIISFAFANLFGLALDFVNDKLYWTDTFADKIRRADLDGSSQEDVISNTGAPGCPALDVAAGRIYWTDGSSVHSANLDGSSALTFENLSSGRSSHCIAVDGSATGKVYWNYESFTPPARLHRANKDGTSVETVVSAEQMNPGLVLDVVNNKMYYQIRSNKVPRLQRADLDGGNVEDLGRPYAPRIFQANTLALLLKPATPTSVTAAAGYEQVTLSWQAPGPEIGGAAAGYEYRHKTATTGYTGWTDAGSGNSTVLTGLSGGTYTFQVRAGNRIGNGPASATAAATPATTMPGTPGGLRTVEGDRRLTLFWTPGSGGTPAGYQYRRKSGGGTYSGWVSAGAGTEYVVTGLANGMAYTFEVRATNSAGDSAASNEAGGTPEPPQAKMYWQDAGRIQRANLNGATVEDIVVTGLGTAQYIAVDAAGGKMYWTDIGTNKIQRANLDGSGREDLVTGLSSPQGIALDPAAGKMYWIDNIVDKIRRANLDGSLTQDVVTSGLSNGVAIALDAVAGKIYWVDGNRLYRANMADGSSREEVRDLGHSTLGIALDAAAGKLYYTGGARGIRRVNVDGSGGIEVPVPAGMHSPARIALDVAGGKMYWNNSGFTNRIRRANLGGGNVEDLLTTGFSRLNGIALLLKPATPTEVTATVGNAQATLRWKAPAPDAGGSAASYEYQYKTATTTYTRWSDAGIGTSAVAAGLTNGLTYTFRVRAANLLGAGPESDPASVTLSAPPGAPASLTATPGYARVMLSWTAPTGSVTGYQVRWKPAAGTYDGWTPTGGTGTSYAVAGLSNETTYTFQVRALNGPAPGPASDPASATPRMAPGAPMNLRTVEGDTQITLHWTASTGTVAGYEYRRRAGATFAGGDVWRPAAGTFTEYVVTGLTNDLAYTFQVRATNVGGDTASGEAGGTPRAARAKMYWTDTGTNKIQRANLNGTTVEDIATGLDNPGHIAVDAAAGKIYWSDTGADKIQRANLDGTGRQDLIITGLIEPRAIALDPAAGKMYWTDSGTDKIERANLDGGSREDVVASGLVNTQAIALDTAGGKIYWFDGDGDRFRRANLADGSSTELMHTFSGTSAYIAIALDAAGGKVYRTLTLGSVRRANLDGSSEQTIASSSAFSPAGIALDTAGGKVYWAHNGTDKIERADLNGENAEDLVTTGLNVPGGVALLLKPGKPRELTATAGNAQATLRWKAPTPDAGGSAASYEYRRGTGATFDGWQAAGTGTEHVVTGLANATTYTFQVRAVNLVDNGPESNTASATPQVPPGATTNLTATGGNARVMLSWTAPTGTITDYQVRWRPAGGNYGEWTAVGSTGTAHTVTGLTNATPHTFQVRALNGTVPGPESNTASATPRVPPGTPTDLRTVEGDRQLALHWVASTGTVGGYEYRQRTGATFDGESWQAVGTGTAHVVTGLTNGTAYTFQVRAINSGGSSAASNEASGTPRAPQAKIYWIEAGRDKVQRANLVDGSTVEDVVTGLTTPRRIAVDAAGGKIYWTDGGTRALHRANLDGSGAERLFSAPWPWRPYGIALDTAAGKIYWTDEGTDRIQHANLDGTGAEDLVATGLNNPVGIVLDVAAGKMYWSDTGTDKIHRANLDGSSAEDLVTSGAVDPSGLALDAAAGRIYWIEQSTNRIRRANVSGDPGTETPETLVTEDNSGAVDLALDTAAGRMYWTQRDNDVIRSAATSASPAVTNLVVGLPSPDGLALLLKPGRPRGLTAAVGNAQATLRWKAPTPDAGGSAASYEYRQRTGATFDGAGWQPAGTGTEHVVTGLANGTAYTFQVRALNLLGNGPESNTAGTTPKPPPGVPTDLAATAGNAEVMLLWKASTGTVTGYQVRWKPAAGTYDGWTPAGGTATSYNAAGLTNGTEYEFQVRAVNSGVPGPESVVTATPQLPPGAPPGLMAAPGNARVMLSWTTPTGTVTGYEIRWKPAAGTYDGWTPTGSTATSYTVAGLANGTRYAFRVRGLNDTVPGPESSTATATPQLPPGVPSGLRTVEGDKQLTLHWSASTGTVTDYEYRRKSGGGAYDGWIGTGSGSRTEYVVTGLLNDMTYTFQVRATNAGVNSAASGEAGGTPRAPQAKIYWALSANSSNTPDQIRRANLDGTMAETILTTGFQQASNITGVAVDAAGEKLYWIDGATGKIHRANLDGTGKEDIVSSLGSGVLGLALDFVNDKLYWGDANADRIRRVNPDGSSREDVITRDHVADMSSPGCPALDVAAGRIYWSDSSTRKVHGANLDGSSVLTFETLPNGHPPTCVAVDGSAGGKVYWSHEGFTQSARVRRAGKDGASVKTVTSTGRIIGGLALDVANSKAYYQTGGIPRIRRVDWDGGNVEDLGPPYRANSLFRASSIALLLEPATPTSVTATAGGEQVLLQWQAPGPEVGGSAASYEYRYRIGATAGYIGWKPAGATTMHTVTGLIGATEYTFQVRAKNLIGHSPASATASTTPTIVTPGAPMNLTAAPGDTRVMLSWKASTGTVTDYEVRWKPVAGTYEGWMSTGGTGTSSTVANLTNGTEYAFQVRAVNSTVPGPESGTATATPQLSPGAPAGLTATPGNARVTLSWTTPTGTVTGYQVRWKPAAGTYEGWVPAGSTATSHIVAGLANGTRYAFQVRAVNRGVPGPQSNTASATLAMPPGAPANLTAAPGNARVMLSWQASTGTITGYQVRWKPAAGTYEGWTPVGSTGTSHTVAGLTNATMYAFQVRALNGPVPGPESNTASATPQAPPGAPANLTATPGNARAMLSWAPPTGTVTGYQVRWKTTTGTYAGWTPAGGTDTSHTVAGLTNGTMYAFQVRGLNGAVAGPASSTATATPQLPPGAPANLTATAGNARVMLSWTTPTGIVTSYQVRWQPAAGTYAGWTPVGSTGTSHTVAGLTNGTMYAFQVRALNGAVAGPASSTATATPQLPPGAPADLTAAPGNARAMLSWAASTGTITGYQVQWKPTTGTYAGWMPTGSTDTSHTVVNLTNGTMYTFQVRALNNAVPGPASNTARATPAAGIKLRLRVFLEGPLE